MIKMEKLLRFRPLSGNEFKNSNGQYALLWEGDREFSSPFGE